jgi:Ca-activated chloride channel family protein
VNSLIDSLPGTAQVGLQVYGTGTGSSDAEQAAGCADIKTLVPVGPLAAEEIKSQVNSVVAAGYTPIGNALRAAAEALPKEGPRSIVLVSDGEDTCAPPTPCDVAGELHQQGVDLVVHTVGFKVDAAARDQLSCIAQTTGGTYSDAADASQLNDALATKVDYAITGYTTAGSPVTGADLPTTQAALLAPGQYVDTFDRGATGSIDAPGTKKYYSIAVQEGMRPYISVTMVPPDADAEPVDLIGVDAALLNVNGETCTTERGAVVLTNGRNTTATAVLDGPTFGSSEAASSCPTEGLAFLEVTRLGAAWADIPLQTEIVVRMEPPAKTSGLLPAATKGAELPPVAHGTPVALAGGNSFNDAPQLNSGTTYSDTIATGESRFYRVPLQWGQRVSYLVSEVGPPQPPTGVVGTIVWLDLFNPVRAEITGTIDNGGSTWFGNDPGAPFYGSSPYPVRYTNREATKQDGYSLDGDYYLRMNANRDEDPSTTSFLLTVVVIGEIEPGPTYLVAGASTTAGNPTTAGSPANSQSSAPITSPEASPVSTSQSGQPAIDAAATPTSQASPVASTAIPAWVWGLVAVLAAAAVAALLVVRARRRPAHPGSTDQPGSGDQPGDRHW